MRRFWQLQEYKVKNNGIPYFYEMKADEKIWMLHAK